LELVDILEKVKSYLRLVLRRWWLVLLTMIGVSVLMIFIAIKKEVTYISKTIFHPQQSSNGPTDPFALLFSGGEMGGTGNQEMQAILESAHLSEMVAADTVLWQGKPITITKLFMELNPPKAPSIDQWINKKLNAWFAPKSGTGGAGGKYEPSFKDSVVQVATGLKKTVELKESERGMVEMTFYANNPQFLKTISYKYIHKLTDYYKANRTLKSKESYHFLAKRTDSVKRELMGSISKGAQYLDKNQFGIFAEQQVPVKKTEGETQILQAMYAQLVTMREGALNQLLQDTPVLQVLDYPNPPYENNKPKLAIYFFIGLVVGFIVGIVLAVFGMLRRDIKDYINETLLKPAVKKE
jgi:uncharacterized protein involved in exopolysaccharide biosynthesis